MESSSSSTPPAAVTDGASPDPPGLHRVESIGIIDVGRTDEANLCILTHMKQPTTSTEDDFQTLVKRSSRTMIEPTSAAGGHEGPIVVERSDGLHRDLVKVSLNPQATGSELKDGIPDPKKVRIIHMANTHNYLGRISSTKYLPRGDILVHSGDFSNEGTTEEFHRFNSFLGDASRLYQFRVVVFGQNDVKIFKKDWDRMRSMLPNATHVLCYNEAVILGLKFYGHPWTMEAPKKSSIFSRSSGASAIVIPKGVDVLVSGAAAYGRLDVTHTGEHKGQVELAEAIKVANPLLHLHGAVHESRGFLNMKAGEGMVVNSCMADYQMTCLCNTAHVVSCKLVHYDDFKKQKWSFGISTLGSDAE